MPSIMEDPAMDVNYEEDEEGAVRIGDIYIPPPPLPCLTFDPTGPRLIISHIVIENFKSYGGKVTLGPFQKNFSAVVGPNGSGKSNVIDSMLFVFGYRAQKIRSQTVGVLIHSSDTYPNVTSCSVNVHFQKIIDKSEDDFEVVKDSEFVITRTAYKDNSSHYSINNRKVPFKEVSRLLRSYGIDLDHNRFLILQGEVEQISLMKPKSPNEHETGMLEFLEDIIGSGRFKEPIEILGKKVEELNELRTEKLKRVKAVEKEKDDLEGPKNEAIEYINWKNHLVVKQHAIAQHYMYECKQKIQHTTEKKESIETDQKEFLANFHELEKKIEDVEKERIAFAKDYSKICKEHEDNTAKVNEHEITDMKRREDLKYTSGKIKEMVQSLEKEKKKLNELEIVPTKLEEEISSLQNRLDNELAKQKIEFEENEQRVMASLRNETKDLQADKDRQEQNLMVLQKPLDEAQAKLGIVQVELDLYMRNAQNEENRHKEMQTTIEKNIATRQEMETEIRSLTVALPQEEELLSKDVAEIKVVTADETRANDIYKSQRLRLEEMRNALVTSHSRGRILEALMGEKAAGRITGIIGRLGDLGAIDEKYDIAISTACRPLDNIVTETLTAAENCVAFLKRNNLGQATFIALDKMQSWNEHIKKKFTAPRGVCRLFDLIKVKNEAVLPAFYFALRDTLVADDINQATEIGLQGRARYRVVTLNGELIETSGTMSGGGNRPMRGRMGTSVAADAVSPQQVEAVQIEVNQLQSQLDELTPKKLRLQEGISTRERLVQQMKHTIQKRKIEYEELTQQGEALKLQIKEQAKKVKATKPDERKIQELTENLEREKHGVAEADKAASKVKAVIQRLHNQIMEVTGTKLKAAQKQVQDINKEIDEATSAINKKRVGIKTAKRNFTKSREKIANIEAEIEESHEKKKNLKKVMEEAEDTLRDLFNVLETLKDEKTKLEKSLTLVSDNADRFKAELQEIKSQKMDIDHELKQLTDSLKKHEARMNTYKKDLSRMSLEQMEGTETLELQMLSEEELQHFDLNAYNYGTTVLMTNLEKAKPNLAAIAEYFRKEQVYLQRVEEMDAMTKERDTQRGHHDSLRKQRLTEFMKGFGIITQKLKETYQMLTLGGDAELELVNSLDPFSDGIVFSVRPPRKSWKNISNLSGGEKTLSSLALVFALHYYKPTPFYVMDEIDAALDFRNVTIVGHYIKEQTKNAQFIVISLRNNMFELADRLVGVYKTYNTSHSVAIDPRSAINAEGR